MSRCTRKSAKSASAQQHRTMLLLRRFGSSLFDQQDDDEESGQLFACPVCREVLDSPVTINCGHTYCARCLDKLTSAVTCVSGSNQMLEDDGSNKGRTRCLECHLFFDNSPRPAMNVLVQDIVDKWRSSQKDLDSKGASRPMPVPETSDILGLEPRYWLRTRHAGLQPLPGHDENHIYKIIRKLMIYGRGGRRKRVSLASAGDDQGRLRRTWSTRGGTPCNTSDNNFHSADADVCSSEERALLLRILKSVRDIRDRALRTTWLSPAPSSTLSSTTSTTSDLDCILCSRILHEPVTTECGHTFCRECLARVLDHGRACPLCMRPLLGVDRRGVTKVLDRAVRVLAPLEWRKRCVEMKREIRMMDDDEQVPVFVCTNAFPGVACPLFVYVPRYRLLARRCLQSRGRRFAMAARLPIIRNANVDNAQQQEQQQQQQRGQQDQERFASFGTLLEVRDAVYLKDGRAIFTTVGVRRFRVLEKGEQDGYDTARVQYIRDHAVTSDRLPELCALHTRVHAQARRWVASLATRLRTEVESCIGRMPALEPHWHKLADGPAWAWWLMPILPLSTQLQVGFLSTTSLEKRLRAIEKMLHHMKYVKYLERKSLKFSDADENAVSCRLSWMM